MSEVLTIDTFKEKVFDYEQGEKWNYKGDSPAIIDFYADWCQPCKVTGPIIDELDKEYEDIDIYKVDVEETPEIAGLFGVTGIPMFLFVPPEGTPSGVSGALPKEKFVEAINDIFYGKKAEVEESKSGLVDSDGKPY
jgi:thioredoxin 1